MTSHRDMLTADGRPDWEAVNRFAHERTLREYRLMERLDGSPPSPAQAIATYAHEWIEARDWVRAMQRAIPAGKMWMP
jgi:hypothetical protein